MAQEDSGGHYQLMKELDVGNKTVSTKQGVVLPPKATHISQNITTQYFCTTVLQKKHKMDNQPSSIRMINLPYHRVQVVYEGGFEMTSRMA